MKNNGERINEIISRFGLSKADFARKVGEKPQTVSNWVARDNGMNVLNKIFIAFPEVNQDWLMTGHGEMLSNAVEVQPDAPGTFYTETHNGTPVYDIDATCGTESRDMDFTDEHIVGYVDLPGVNKNACIIRANGDSMEPRIFNGNMVVIREIKNWEDVFYGQIYLILLDEYRMIKYIRRYEPDEGNYIILRSENPKYDDIKLHKSKIRKLFIVENILSVRAQL